MEKHFPLSEAVGAAIGNTGAVPRARRRRDISLILLLGALVLLGSGWTFHPPAHSEDTQAATLASNQALSPDQLIDSFRRVEVASVSDAMEQITGQKAYMDHSMRPIFTSKFAGYAVTVRLVKAEGHQGSAALAGMLQAIDTGAPNSVYVMTVEDGVDIAGMGGLMGTAMRARGYAGAVIDGGVRDVAYLTKIGFPVFARGIVPSTSVNHYRFAGSNIPVVCDGVTVNPGDIVVADTDGVVIIPRKIAARVLTLAQEMDFKEHSMYPYIDKFKSIEEAVKRFGRI